MERANALWNIVGISHVWEETNAFCLIRYGKLLKQHPNKIVIGLGTELIMRMCSYASVRLFLSRVELLLESQWATATTRNSNVK